MKRGFLNTKKAKRTIDEAYASGSPQALGTSPAAIERAGGQVSRGGNASATSGGKVGTSTGVNANKESRDEPMSGVTVESTPTGIPQAVPPTTAQSHSTDRNGKGKKTSTDVPIDASRGGPKGVLTFPARPRPSRPGWGRTPLEQTLHRIPPSVGRGNRKRAIFLQWPRPPNGKPILPSSGPDSDDTASGANASGDIPNHKGRGKLSPDGYPWGETLYDFFHVARVPNCPYVVSIMTGSQLLEAMEEIGEMNEPVTRDVIEWAQSEGEPRDEGVALTEKIVEGREHIVRVLAGGEARIASASSQLHIPVTSPFHPSHYPAPWPLTPFANELDLLQERIPLYLLPQTLHVHDPFDLLSTVEKHEKQTSWNSKPDVIHTYTLNLTESSRTQIDSARSKAEELEDFKSHTLVLLRFQRTSSQIANYEPIVEVPLPPYPKRPTKIEESHLYLSPVAKVGDGHHSVVYKGEWEVPRDVFVRPKICDRCFKEGLEREIKKMKDSGRWEKMLRATGWGPTGYFASDTKPTQEDVDVLEGVNDPPNLDIGGERIERELTCIVPAGFSPMEALQTLEDLNFWDAFLRSTANGANSAELQITKEDSYPPETASTLDRDRPPILRINPTDPVLSYHDPSGAFANATCVCPHVIESGPVPRTATFEVVAKLSLERDSHLETEAKNYQGFPEWFFQHWSGYTIVNQLHTIVPVRAIVPQFYGYYTPKDSNIHAHAHANARGEGHGGGNSKRKEGGRLKRYLSPILLLEHCGTPIDPDKLSIEDKEECASLLLRFQRAGWLHESVYARNLLVQMGSPTEFPTRRGRGGVAWGDGGMGLESGSGSGSGEMGSEEAAGGGERSFRLIDFGRSRKYEKIDEKRAEEGAVLRLFEELRVSMGTSIG